MSDGFTVISPSERDLIDSYGLSFDEAQQYIESQRQVAQVPITRAALDLLQATTPTIVRETVGRVEKEIERTRMPVAAPSPRRQSPSMGAVTMPQMRRFISALRSHQRKQEYKPLGRRLLSILTGR